MRIRKSGPQRRLEVVEAALRLAAMHGPDRITAEAIARELGMTQPAIFRHFPTKADIWNAVVQHLEDELTRLWTVGAESAPPGARLAAVIDSHLRFIAGHPAVPLVLLSPELHARHPQLRGAVGRLMGLFHAKLRGLLADGGNGCPPADAEAGAWMIISLVQGIAVRWAGADQAFDIVAEGRKLIALALRGLEPKAD